MAKTRETTGLTERQRRFVEAYTGEAQGNASKAAKLAGYPHADVQGTRMLGNVRIRAAIEQARAPRTESAILTRAERQELLTQFANDRNVKPTDRIRAVEILGKMHGDFIERIEHSGSVEAVHVYLPSNGRDE